MSDRATFLERLRRAGTKPDLDLVFSTLSAANAAYKLMGQIGGAEVIGPVLLGMARPVHLLQRGSTTQDVFNLATIASVDASGVVTGGLVGSATITAPSSETVPLPTSMKYIR